MTCKDCVHYDVCKEHSNFIFSKFGYVVSWKAKKCEKYKNKADFVEVKWISVKDRLPETNGKYLCANYSKTFNRYFIEVLNFAKDLHKVDEFDFKEEKGKSGFYMYDSEWGYSHFRNVTNWMPLPEPPKE